MTYQNKILRVMKLSTNKTVFDTYKDKFYNTSCIFYHQGELFRLSGLANPKTKETKNIECWLMDQSENPIERCKDFDIYVNQIIRLNEEVKKKLNSPLSFHHVNNVNKIKDEDIENIEEYIKLSHLQYASLYTQSTNLMTEFESEKASILYIFLKYSQFKKNKLTQAIFDHIKYTLHNSTDLSCVQLNTTTYKNIKFINIILHAHKNNKLIFRVDDDNKRIIYIN